MLFSFFKWEMLPLTMEQQPLNLRPNFAALPFVCAGAVPAMFALGTTGKQ
jgi:hypothetical protein